MKHIEKLGEKLMYGGDLPTYFVSDVLDEDILCPYGDDRIQIYFNSPIKKSPDESRGFSFYSSFADMQVYLYSNTAPQGKKMQIKMYVG